MKKFISIICLIAIIGCLFAGCDLDSTTSDVANQKEVTDKLTSSQATPTDIDYSLERYNLIRRAYWVNGQREKANTLVCEVQKPLGYIVLFTESGGVVGRFLVDGKVSSLNSFLTPSFIDIYRGEGGAVTEEMADVDGSYGENDAGIFFFTPAGQYIEWTGTYLYSDIPFIVDDPIVKVEDGVL
jgi:hypothetical protein